jgi:hypothetical protein
MHASHRNAKRRDNRSRVSTDRRKDQRGNRDLGRIRQATHKLEHAFAWQATEQIDNARCAANGHKRRWIAADTRTQQRDNSEDTT